MPATLIPVSKLLEKATDVNIPVYLDATSLRAFGEWTRTNEGLPSDHILKQFIERVNTDGLEVFVFKDQLQTTHGRRIEATIKQIELLGVEIDETSWYQEDDLYAAEVQNIYFHDEKSELATAHAKFLVLARNAARNEARLRVLSGHPAFQRLVNAEVFALPISTEHNELPANFDVFADLLIHKRIRDVVSGDFYRKDYPKVVFQAVNALRDYVREVTGLATDGGALMNDALNPQAEKDRTTLLHVARRIPPLKFNALTPETEVNEQDGYYRFAQGIFKAIRNPEAHLSWNDPFITSRFNDKRVAVKILCLLSLLCEKIDNRVP